MSDQLKNILSNSNKDIDNQQLMDYLSKQLSKEQAHDLEKAMLDDEFTNDAVEGLQQLSNKQTLETYTEQLNRQLQLQLKKKQQRKDKRNFTLQPWLYFTAALLLLLIILCFFLVRYYNKR